jgi:hypothetical protein
MFFGRQTTNTNIASVAGACRVAAHLGELANSQKMLQVVLNLG